jgi:hypothetical protein
MADSTNNTQDNAKHTQDELALELTKFIAVQTGYGKSSGPSAGFGAKGANSPEVHADALIELFQRCRKVVKES